MGECKWGANKVSLAVVKDLIERKGPRLREFLQEKRSGWTLHFAIFARAGLTSDALAELHVHNGFAVDLSAVDQVLSSIQ